MQRYGDRKRVPAFAYGEQVLVAVRNAFEHWDGSRPYALAEHSDAACDDYTFAAGGTVIAGVLRVDDLAAQAAEAQEYLLRAERDGTDTAHPLVRTNMPGARCARRRALLGWKPRTPGRVLVLDPGGVVSTAKLKGRAPGSREQDAHH